MKHTLESLSLIMNSIKIQIRFSQAMNGENSKLYHDAMIEEMEYMAKIKVLVLVQLPFGHSTVDYKWIYKTKGNTYGKIE